MHTNELNITGGMHEEFSLPVCLKVEYEENEYLCCDRDACGTDVRLETTKNSFRRDIAIGA